MAIFNNYVSLPEGIWSSLQGDPLLQELGPIERHEALQLLRLRLLQRLQHPQLLGAAQRRRGVTKQCWHLATTHLEAASPCGKMGIIVISIR